MEIVGKKILEKHKRKNKGNVLLQKEIDILIEIIESSSVKSKLDIVRIRPDAD
jgi:hypothetical protein